MLNNNLKTVKRIMSDLKENAEQPIEGINLYLVDRPNENNSAASNLDDDTHKELFTLHCDIDIKHGPYAGVVVHTILQIPPKYPYAAPAMNIASDYEFTHEYHEHVLGKSICNDMLSNYAWFFESSFASQPKVASGWSSGYTLNVILSQMQIFFADPDLPERSMPSDWAIERLKKFSRNYKCKTCAQKRTYNDLVGKSADSNKEVSKEERELLELSKQLVCGITKQDFTIPDIILGYPLMMRRDRFDRMWPALVLENISYEAYVQKIQMAGIDKLDNFTGRILYSANGEQFNYWTPIYVNETHFQRALEHIKNAISVIRRGIQGTKDNDFRPDMILEVLPCLMNKTTVHIMNGTLFHSTAAIQAYCNFLRLYLRLIQMFNLKPLLNERVKRFTKNLNERNKKQCGDLGEFIINAFLSDVSYANDESLKKSLVTELFTRQIYWIESKTGNRALESYKTSAEMLAKAFEGGQTSNHLFLFNIEIAKFFIEGSEEKTKVLDARLGFLPDHVIKSFQDRVVQIKAVGNFGTLMSAIGYSSYVKSPEEMYKFLIHCKKLAIQQGYIRQ